jgi:hypothetical protein
MRGISQILPLVLGTRGLRDRDREQRQDFAAVTPTAVPADRLLSSSRRSVQTAGPATATCRKPGHPRPAADSGNSEQGVSQRLHALVVSWEDAALSGGRSRTPAFGQTCGRTGNSNA